MSKRICCLLVVLICFFFSSLDVDAATRKGAGCYGGCDAQWDGNNGTFVGKYIGSGSNKTTVYCVNHSKDFEYGTGVTYNSSSRWASSSDCSYGSHSNLDCSMMTGFVMHYASQYGGYVFIQQAAQTFLWLHSGNTWNSGNADYSTYSSNGVKISKIIEMAYAAYTAYVGASITNPGVTVTLSDVKDVNDDTDNGLYYDGSGAYYSYGIKVSAGLSNGSGSVDVILGTNSSKVRICLSANAEWDDCSQSVTIENISSTRTVYLITKSASDFKNANSISLTATATYYQKGSSYAGYDTTRWCVSSSADRQCLLSFEKTNKKLAGKNYTATATRYYKAVPVKSSGCSKLYSGWSESDSVKNGTSGSALVCQNNASGSSIEDSSKYTAEFKSCTLNKSYKMEYYYKDSSGQCVYRNNATTTIAIGEQGKFTFGGVEGDTHPVITGQGFYLVSNNTYVVNLSWKKALAYSSNNYAYFYLSNSSSIHHNTTVYASLSDCQAGNNGKTFDNYANSYMSSISIGSNIDVSTPYKTYVNNSKKLESVPAEVEATGDNITSPIGSISDKSSNYLTVTYKFSTPVAYTKISDNTITYDNSVNGNSSYKNLGNRYYTMVKYSGSTYPFNLNIGNLSVVAGITWSLEGICNIPIDVGLYDCDEKTETCSLNYDYRSISVSNPFPKATSVDDVAENWQEAYNDITTMNRIYHTFGGAIIYSITLTGDSATTLANKYTNSYELFDKISNDGKSSFVTDNFDTITSYKSYCGIGVWNSDCDR